MKPWSTEVHNHTPQNPCIPWSRHLSCKQLERRTVCSVFACDHQPRKVSMYGLLQCLFSTSSRCACTLSAYLALGSSYDVCARLSSMALSMGVVNSSGSMSACFPGLFAYVLPGLVHLYWPLHFQGHDVLMGRSA